MADGKNQGQPPTGQAMNPPPYNAHPQPPPLAAVGFQPLLQPRGNAVVITTVATTHGQAASPYRDIPVIVQCPSCQNQVTSTCIYENGMMVWLLVVLLLLFQLWMGCCLIPLCITGLKDVRHICPVCKFQLGIYKRL